MKIIWSDNAKNDLNGIYEYIAKDSEYYAKIFTTELIFSVDTLETQPSIGRKVPEFNINNMRELIHHNYRIIYLINESADTIYILTVIHGSRDLNRHLDIDDI